ncbi:hypothetical protein M569_06846, partial [Genlisea aurea]
SEMFIPEPEPELELEQDHEQETTPANVELEPPIKRRKKKSVVWEHFTIESVGPGCRRAYCKQCKQSFAYSTGSKVAGTSHLKRHIAKGTCPAVQRSQQQQQLITYGSVPAKMPTSDTPRRRFRTSNSAVPFLAFDADLCRHEIAKMIIMHDYPLHMVEHPGFLAFVRSLQPRFDMVSFNTVQGDCVATYLKEKHNIHKVFESLPGRVSLTLDLWSSSRTVGYMFVTGLFVDTDWKLHRKLLNVIMEPYPESDTAFSHSVAACLSDWNLDGKLFSVTVNQPLSDAAVDNLRALLSVKNPMVLDGQLLVGNCLARSLSSIVQETLASVHDVVKKVRDSVKYVKTSESREEKFVDLKDQLQVPTSTVLAIDDQTRWNTTYEMLVAASELKQVFSCLDTPDPDYKDAPTAEEWKRVETLCFFLKPLFDTASLLATSAAPTTNAFFHEAWKILFELSRSSASEDPFIGDLAKSMQEKFNRYWKGCSFVLAAGVIMDPRFKMKLVEFSFSKIYGDEAASYVKVVDDGIHELFQEYVTLPLPLTPAYAEEQNGAPIKTTAAVAAEAEPEGSKSSSNSNNNASGLMDFDAYIIETTSQLEKSELDRYLEESLLPRVQDFDVVGWWKINRMNYPTLSKMARDILSSPVCTVCPDSVFDTTGKEMDGYRCSLRPETVEALVCAKDWLTAEKRDSASATASPTVKME